MFECNHCQMVMKTKLNLKLHSAEVHEVKIRECSFCDKTFQKQSDLNVHLNDAHKGMKYQCDLCKDNFGSQNKANLHMRMFHKIKEEHSQGLIKLIGPTNIKQGIALQFYPSLD